MDTFSAMVATLAKTGASAPIDGDRQGGEIAMRAESEIRCEAVVVGPGAPGFLKVSLGHRRASVGPGIIEVPADRIPVHLRGPNSRFVAVSVPGGVARVEEEYVGLPKMEVEDKVRRVLNRWDPIGVADEVDDEYDGYIPHVLALLRSGADEASIAKHLLAIESERMGLEAGSWTDRLSVASELRQITLIT